MRQGLLDWALESLYRFSFTRIPQPATNCYFFYYHFLIHHIDSLLWEAHYDIAPKKSNQPLFEASDPRFQFKEITRYQGVNQLGN